MNKLMLRFRCLRFVNVLSVFLAAGIVGCGGKDIRVYDVPKDISAIDAHADLPVSAVANEPPARLTWVAPTGWDEAPRGEMRLASFKVKGEGNRQADISVIALSGTAGGDLNNVNRWRGQVGAPPVKSEELSNLSEKTGIGGTEGDLFDLAGSGPSGDATRVIAMILHRDGEVWFFKMAGDDELVAKQKPVFLAFLKSVKFMTANEGPSNLPAGHPPISPPASLPQDHPPIAETKATPATKSPSSVSANFNWVTPRNWKEETATQMLVAKFSVGENAKRAEITASSFPGDVGGLLANVNRWRGQVGLAPITATDLPRAVKELKVASATGTLLELKNADEKSPSLIGVSLPHNGQTWFFKMIGDAKTVAREKDAFIKFVQSVKLSNAP
jgi:hypothetical protein